MFLQLDRSLGASIVLVVAVRTVSCWSQQGLLMVQHQTILDDRDAGRTDQVVIRVPSRRLEHDVVSLPFPRGPASVHQWRRLSIQSATLAVGVGRIIEVVQHLNFIKPVNNNSAVAALLAGAANTCRLGKFQMQLETAELVPGPDAA